LLNRDVYTGLPICLCGLQMYCPFIYARYLEPFLIRGGKCILPTPQELLATLLIFPLDAFVQY